MDSPFRLTAWIYFDVDTLYLSELGEEIVDTLRIKLKSISRLEKCDNCQFVLATYVLRNMANMYLARADKFMLLVLLLTLGLQHDDFIFANCDK